MNTEQAIQRWNQYAERYTANYDEQGDIHRVVLLNPTIFSLLEEVDGKHVLDAGCGEGYLSRLLAKKGASVTAVDFSQKCWRLLWKEHNSRKLFNFTREL